MPTQKLTNEIIAAAIEGFEAQKRRIDERIGELRAMLSGRRTEAAAVPSAPRKRKRRMSAAGRRAIAEATRKRWAAFHAAKEAAETSAVPRKAAPKKTARKKVAAKNVSVKAPAKTSGKHAPIKKAAIKKAVARKTAPAPAQVGMEAAGPS